MVFESRKSWVAWSFLLALPEVGLAKSIKPFGWIAGVFSQESCGSLGRVVGNRIVITNFAGRSLPAQERGVDLIHERDVGDGHEHCDDDRDL